MFIIEESFNEYNIDDYEPLIIVLFLFIYISSTKNFKSAIKSLYWLSSSFRKLHIAFLIDYTAKL